MLIAIQGPRVQKDKRDEENWLSIGNSYSTASI
jgi:hypothetical protein